MRRRRLVIALGQLLVALALVLVVTSCGSAAHAARVVRWPEFCKDQQQVTACVVADHGRFVVAVDRPLISATTKVGVSLDRSLMRALDRIGRLLPGPVTDIQIVGGTLVIPHTGVMGSTGPDSGLVTVTLDVDENARALRRTVLTWLLQDLTHEVDHSVRILAGPGFGTTLLDQLVSEGMATAFDIQVQPRLDLPWTHVLTARRERSLWNRARPLLNQTGLYDQWFFGGAGVPDDAGFQIGYHIARDYLARHPRSTAASIVDTPSRVIIASSQYNG
jgi:hypothetical protein